MENNFSQSLEDQSIFFLLGVLEENEAEKEEFLERLQKTIWDDFLDNDVELLLTEDEVGPLIEIINQVDLTEAAKQEKMVTYLESLIPDLEDILMEKALKLKEDLVRERVLSLEQFVDGDQEKAAKLQEIKDLMQAGQWTDVGKKLNQFNI